MSRLVFFAVLVPSVILHEVAHGAVALAFGDDTARRAGRLTLNPLKHVDPLGTVVLPAMLVLAGAPAFGWAKPVPVNPSRLRSPRQHSLVVSLAGPATNIVLALAAASFVQLLLPHVGVVGGAYVTDGSVLARVVLSVGIVNVILAAFNLLPIPPLDGSAVIERFLPRSWWPGWLRFRQYSMGILLVLVLATPTVLDRVFLAALDLWERLL